jgi:predicted DNA-binding transcriptional regulator YafY
MAMRAVAFDYLGGSRPGARRVVAPYGLMFGRANYLVAAELGADQPRNWRLDRIQGLDLLATPAAPPADFSLEAYADSSFGIYQGDVEDVVLRVSPAGAEDALGWRFHASQRLEPQPDGGVIVRFRASGMRELAWHLFTWGDRLEILAPASLRAILTDELERALAHHGRPAPGSRTGADPGAAPSQAAGF